MHVRAHMDMCVSVQVSVWMCAHVCGCGPVCVRLCAHVFIVHMHVSLGVGVCVHAHVCMGACVCVRRCVHAPAHGRMCAGVCVCACVSHLIFIHLSSPTDSRSLLSPTAGDFSAVSRGRRAEHGVLTETQRGGSGSPGQAS